MPIDFIGTNMFTEIAVLFIVFAGISLVFMWVRPYMSFNKYLTAFKIGLLQNAAVRENIDIEGNVKKTSKRYVEDIIDQKIQDALEIKNGK